MTHSHCTIYEVYTVNVSAASSTKTPKSSKDSVTLLRRHNDENIFFRSSYIRKVKIEIIIINNLNVHQNHPNQLKWYLEIVLMKLPENSKTFFFSEILTSSSHLSHICCSSIPRKCSQKSPRIMDRFFGSYIEHRSYSSCWDRRWTWFPDFGNNDALHEWFWRRFE